MQTIIYISGSGKRFFSQKQVVSFNLSDIGEGIAEVLVKEWYVSVGQKVNQFDSICEVQSDKASVTITSKFDGVIRKIYYEVDETAQVGQPLVDIEIDEQSTDTSNQLVDEIDDQDAYDRSSSSDVTFQRKKDVFDASSSDLFNPQSYKRTLATPAVRRLAAENSINLSDVRGTGKDGRVMKEDILAHLDKLRTLESSKRDSQNDDQLRKMSSSSLRSEKEEKKGLNKQISSSSTSDVVASKKKRLTQNETVKVSPITRGMIKSMTSALCIPHLALSDEINVSKLLEMKKILETFNAHDSTDSDTAKITLLPIMIKAVSLSLTQFPLLNSVFSESRDEITYIASHNIAFAMATPHGLLVPNVKSVENLSIFEIASQIKRLMQAGSRGQLSPDDLAGGTFTLSNIGSVSFICLYSISNLSCVFSYFQIGGSFGIPVIMPPQVAIGAIGRIQSVPRFASSTSNEIIRASIMQVVWTADHRIIDGATVARFNEYWKMLLEQPVSMLMDLK